jgi:metal-responsive CopG/Arc/MetJ family transcriptional regulator
MSRQLTIRLSKDMKRALEAASRRTRQTQSEIVRSALAQFLNLEPCREEAPAARVQGLIGSLETGISDLSENHRSYVLLSLKHGR